MQCFREPLGGGKTTLIEKKTPELKTITIWLLMLLTIDLISHCLTHFFFYFFGFLMAYVHAHIYLYTYYICLFFLHILALVMFVFEEISRTQTQRGNS